MTAKKQVSTLDFNSLVKAMLGAAKLVLGKRWKKSRDYAESEFNKIGESLKFIAQQVAKGQMTVEQAKLHLELQKNASKTILLTLEGLGLLIVEEAMNAALKQVKQTVNKALGFALL